jgi:hypothetical protein
MAVADLNTKAVELSALDEVDHCSHGLMAALVALAALDSEVTANLTAREIEAAKSALIVEAVNRCRDLRGLFE